MIRYVAAALGASLALLLAPAHAAFGDKDCSFGVNGVQTVPGTFGPLFGGVEEPGGSAILRFGFTSTSSNIYRIDALGTTSTSLGILLNPQVLDPGHVILADGKILFSNGAGAIVNGSVVAGVPRFLSTGGLDGAFGNNGIATVSGLTGAHSAPIVQPDGRILVGGRMAGTSGNPEVAVLARFNADGTADASFGSGGAATNPGGGGNYVSIALQADGKILAVSAANRKLWRHAADGQLDPTFGAGGVADLAGVFPSAILFTVRLQPSGKILIAGLNNQAPIRIARFDATGALDTTVAGGAGYRDVSVPAGPVKAGYAPLVPLTVMPDGRPIISGSPNFNSSNSNNTGAIVRYTVDLADDAVVPLPIPPSGVFPLPDGRMLIGGFQGSGTVQRLLGDADAATCITTATSVSSSPNPSTFGQSVTVTAAVTPSASPPAQGTMQFRHEGTNLGSPVTLSNGVATISASSLPEGPSNLTAVFTGTGSYLGSTSPTYVHTVTPRTPTTTTLTSSPNPSTSGQAVTLTAVVAPQSGTATPAGTVQFKDGAVSLGSPLSPPPGSGTVSLITSALGDGTHTLTAVYSGDTSLAPSTSAPVTHVIPVRLTISDPSVNAAGGAATMNFFVSLTASSTSTVTVNYATADHTAVAGTHYTATNGTLTFTPGQVARGVAVQVAQSQPGPAKDFFLTLTNPTNAGLAKGAGVGTITYADASTLALYINDPSVAEGPSGTTLLGFNVTLSRPVSSTVRVDYATADGTAMGGTDYTAKSGTLAFAPGVTQRWVLVPITGNITPQSNRTLFVNLTNPTVATIGKAQGTGTIIDDDPTPAASTIAMLRLYSDVTKEHLYTTDTNEYAILGTRNWVQEGTAYTMFSTPGTFGAQYAIPLYRMYHAGIQQHHWTTDANEVMTLVMTYGSWSYEGIPGYLLPAAGAGTTPLYRLSYPSPPIHLWTTDAYEKDVLSTQYGWVYENITGEVLP